MYIRKLPSWACCQRKKWPRWEKMWGNYSGVSERTISWSRDVEYKFCNHFIVNCETCGLQAGGWPQTEDCWEIDSNREVCSKEGPAILFFQPCETSCPCVGENTYTLLLLSMTLYLTLFIVLNSQLFLPYRKWCMYGMVSQWLAKDPSWLRTFWPH